LIDDVEATEKLSVCSVSVFNSLHCFLFLSQNNAGTSSVGLQPRTVDLPLLVETKKSREEKDVPNFINLGDGSDFLVAKDGSNTSILLGKFGVISLLSGTAYRGVELLRLLAEAAMLVNRA
jgi:hypothetical protein